MGFIILTILQKTEKQWKVHRDCMNKGVNILLSFVQTIMQPIIILNFLNFDANRSICFCFGEIHIFT